MKAGQNILPFNQFWVAHFWFRERSSTDSQSSLLSCLEIPSKLSDQDWQCWSEMSVILQLNNRHSFCPCALFHQSPLVELGFPWGSHCPPRGSGFYYPFAPQHTGVILHHRYKKTSILCWTEWLTRGEIGLCLPLSFFHKCSFSPKVTALTLENSFRKYSRLNLSVAPLAAISYPDSLSSNPFIWSWRSQTSTQSSNPVPERALHHARSPDGNCCDTQRAQASGWAVGHGSHWHTHRRNFTKRGKPFPQASTKIQKQVCLVFFQLCAFLFRVWFFTDVFMTFTSSSLWPFETLSKILWNTIFRLNYTLNCQLLTIASIIIH